MEIEIIKEKENPLLNRKELEFSIVHEGETPSRLAVRDSLAAKLDKSSDEVLVHNMDTKFGINETIGYAKVYESPDTARDVEEDYMLERNKIHANGGDEEESKEEAEEAEETEVDEDENKEEAKAEE